MAEEEKTYKDYVIPLEQINPIYRKQITANLNKFNTEERLLSLLLTVIIRQLDPKDQNKAYILKNIRHLNKINRATAYFKYDLSETADKIWKEAFSERTIDVTIAGFCVALIHRREKQFKKMSINKKDFARLAKEHDKDGYNMVNLKTVNLILKKTDRELEVLKNKETK